MSEFSETVPSPWSRAADSAPVRLFRRIWFGKDLERPTYNIAAALFLRLLGLIYLIAFVSLWVQISGLVGDSGILPVADYLDAVARHFAAQDPPGSPVWHVPTLLWLSPHDGMLHLLCALGTLFALLLIAGLMPLPALVLSWLCYLSVFHAGQVFLSFQWDILLLETGFLAIFLAPLAWRSRFLADPHPPRLAIWLVWWLLFRLMFESGIVKLTWNDTLLGPDSSPLANTWESLTALDYHYWTQPLPIWTSWYVAQLPEWFQKLCVVGVFIIELVLPWLIFGPRVLRYVAFGGITLLMVLIGATGNYNFFNLLSFALALMLLDDRAWPRFLQRHVRDPAPSERTWPKRVRNSVLFVLAGPVIVLGLLQLKQAVWPAEPGRQSLSSPLQIAQFCLVNSYGLFRQMTETRPEIVIEGSNDGHDWQPYEFRWKPGEPAQPPRFNTPHQPRLDWQMWFEALHLERILEATGTIDPRHMSRWFQSLIKQLLEGNPQVLDLLAKDPFPDVPPRYIRVVLYEYRFTDMDERGETGDWWQREAVWIGPAWSLERPQ